MAKVSEKQNLEFKNQVVQIQDSIKKQLQTDELGVKIDEMIFDLYSLTPEEREIIGFIEIQ